MISLEIWWILTTLQKLPKNVGDLSKLFVAKDFKILPKVKKLPNLVTLLLTLHFMFLVAAFNVINNTTVDQSIITKT